MVVVVFGEPRLLFIDPMPTSTGQVVSHWHPPLAVVRCCSWKISRLIINLLYANLRYCRRKTRRGEIIAHLHVGGCITIESELVGFCPTLNAVRARLSGVHSEFLKQSVRFPFGNYISNRALRWSVCAISNRNF